MSLDVELVKYCKECGCNRQLWSRNVTHNLNKMAAAAGIYEIVWRPKENNVRQAKQLIRPLKAAVSVMKKSPKRFKKHNPKNGWGSYEGFLSFLEEYLVACVKHPDAAVRADR